MFTDPRVRRPFFPVRQDEDAFTALFAKSGKAAVKLHGLYGDHDVAALRSAQPFVQGPTPPEFESDVAMSRGPGIGSSFSRTCGKSTSAALSMSAPSASTRCISASGGRTVAQVHRR